MINKADERPILVKYNHLGARRRRNGGGLGGDALGRSHARRRPLIYPWWAQERGQHDINNEEDYRDGRSGEVWRRGVCEDEPPPEDPIRRVSIISAPPRPLWIRPLRKCTAPPLLTFARHT
jgi:hypothetical protein